MPVIDAAPIELAIMTGTVLVAGLVRGFSGGAGANVLMAPVLSLLLGPREAVPIVLVLNVITSAQVLPGAIPHVTWREILPIGLVAGMTTPIGVWLLFAVDEDLMRRGVAGVAAVFSLLILGGWRYRGRRGVAAGVALGSGAGVLSSAVGISGPPVFLYLMSGPGSAANNRANFLTYTTIVQLFAVVAFWWSGAMSERVLWLAALFVIPFVAGNWLGTRLFHKASEQAFRRITLWGMAVVSVAIVVL